MSRLAVRMGVPRSQLAGKPSRLTLTVDGREVVGLLESPWTPDDVAEALAVQQSEDAACPGCGGDLSQTTDPQFQFDWEAETVRCHNCKARHDETDNVDVTAGLLVRSWLDSDGGDGR